MVRIEIELHGAAAKEEIYDLRNYLKEKLPDANFVLKEQPPLPGQMSGGIVESLMGGLVHAGAAISIEILYHSLIHPLLQSWKEKRKQAGSQLEIMSSLSDSNEKIHFLEDSNGHTEVYNFKYAIDTDKTYALLIGVGKFSNDFHPIPPVKGNIEDLFRLLTDKKHIGLPRENVLVSFNESHVEIQKQLLQASRRPDVHTLIVYYAGHGHRSDVKKLSLIAADTEKIGDEVIGGIDFDFVSNKVMKSSSAKQKILILDTCHSGLATQGVDDLTQNFDVKGSYILSSSPADDVSYFEKNARHTYFTGALLDVLETGVDNTNDMLTLEDIYDYSKDVLIEKKFPIPNAKNELNIPPSSFFIARNPSFSSDKLKWRAYNLFRDGKLEEALDEFRSLLKRFPADEELRKKYEECENELSFSRLVNEANTFFYQKKDYSKAAALYHKAYRLKKDAMVMEKIRQCEQQPAAVPVYNDPLAAVKNNADFTAFKKAYERKSFYTAWKYLKKVKQVFPNTSYVNEELLAIENKLREITDGRKDERLVTYFKYLDSGSLEQAMAELKSQISNDPEHPVFLQLQKSLQRQIKERDRALKEKKESLLFGIFKTFNTKWKAAILIILTGLIITIVVLYVKEMGKKSLAELKQMLTIESTKAKAIELLEKKAKKDDSAKLVLGDYYQQTNNFWTAYSYYKDANLPAAKSATGKMYCTSGIDFPYDTARAREYFQAALGLGKDTLANLYLGLMSLDQYNSGRYDESKWAIAMDMFADGKWDGCVSCKEKLGKMWFDRGNTFYTNGKYSDAYSSLAIAAKNDNVDALLKLGFMFEDSSWWRFNLDSSRIWYQKAASYNNSALAFNEYARTFMKEAVAGSAYYDSAYFLLRRAYQLDPSLGHIYTNFGIVFEYGGRNILRNRDSAIYYYRMAAAKGRPLAKSALKRLGVSEY